MNCSPRTVPFFVSGLLSGPNRTRCCPMGFFVSRTVCLVLLLFLLLPLLLLLLLLRGLTCRHKVACVDQRLDDAPCSPLNPPPSPQVMFRYIGTTFWASRNYLVWWLPFLFFFFSSSSPSSSSFLLSRLVSCLSRRDTEQANRFTHTHTRRSGHQGVSCWVSTLCRCCFLFLFFSFLLFDIVPRSSPFRLFLVILGDPG